MHGLLLPEASNRVALPFLSIYLSTDLFSWEIRSSVYKADSRARLVPWMAVGLEAARAAGPRGRLLGGHEHIPRPRLNFVRRGIILPSSTRVSHLSSSAQEGQLPTFSDHLEHSKCLPA